MKALEGQQFLVITLSVFAPSETHSKLVQAAAKAGVLYVMPNIYGGDVQNEALQKAAIYPVDDRYHEIEKLGVSSYILMSCGF